MKGITIIMNNFLTNNTNFILNTDDFLSHHYHIYIEKQSKYVVKAYEVDFDSKCQHILSTLGEYFEREILCNVNPIKSKTVNMVSLITGHQKTVPLHEVIFNGQFTDSSGMASHRQSEDIIWKAYKEFFERQSFISNFIFQQKADKIHLTSTRLLKLEQYIKNYLDEILYFNISLSQNLFVVLSIGWTKERKAAGLGTSRSLEKAIEKSQKEIMQYFATSSSKENICDSTECFSKDLYHLYFDSLPVQKFQDSFKYLYNTKHIISSDYVSKIPKKSPDEIIANNYNTLSMEPYVAMFTVRKDIGIKVIKIKDFNWFPHLRPELYSSEIFKNIERKFGWTRKNFDNLLPFI